MDLARAMAELSELTTGVVASGQQDATGGLADADQVAGGGGAENAVLADKQLLNPVGGTDLGNLLDNFGVVVAAIATDDQEGTVGTFRNGEEDGGDEGLGVVGLLEDLDLFPQAGTRSSVLVIHLRQLQPNEKNTYVPGFWSVKGCNETVWTDMVDQVGGEGRKGVIC